VSPPSPQPLGLRILVDADACPVKELIERAAARHGVRVLMVTATAMRDRAGGVEVVRIAGGPDAVDDWIVERCAPGDIVVTQDIPLADAAIKRGARVIENRGEILGPGNIGERLAMRDLVMGLRETGILDDGTGGPRPIAARDRNRFAQALGRLLDEARAAEPS
jgi:uncharacterized protein YaiI (UPF0178 family)